MLLAFLVVIVVDHIQAITHRSTIDSKQFYASISLVFDITSKPGMNCFHEEFHVGDGIKISISTFNTQSQHLYMRITSPSEGFSEWFEGDDLVSYEGNATESG
ncbi:unnamed protein product [Toxocara canis]|nr:unnamed protein product [Toxocara canis]